MPKRELATCEFAKRDQGLVLASIMHADTLGRRLAVLGEPLRSRVMSRLAQLATLQPAEKKRAIAQMSAQIVSPLPDHLELIHTEWIFELLDQCPPPVAAAVWSCLPKPHKDALARFHGPCPFSPAVRLRLAAGELKKLHPMHPDFFHSNARGTDVLWWPFERLTRLVERLGAAVLARTVREGQAEDTVSAVKARLGPELAPWLRLGEPLMHRVPEAALDIDSLTLSPITNDLRHWVSRLGCEILGRALGRVEAQSVAQRLPLALGQVLRGTSDTRPDDRFRPLVEACQEETTSCAQES